MFSAQEYYFSILKQMKSKQQSFDKKCTLSLKNLRQKLDNKVSQTQLVLQKTQQSVLEARDYQNNLIDQMKNKKHQLKETQKLINATKSVMQLEQNQLQQVIQLQQELQYLNNYFSKEGLVIIDSLNDKQQKVARVQQFIKRCQVPNISVKTIQPYQRRIFTPVNKTGPQHDIEFNPEDKQITFRVQTFEGKIVEFVLFFDKVEKKFGLKNPWKSFNGMDVIAVKGFNIHKNRYRLLEEFKGLVKKCIDNADDLPKYEDQFA